MSDSALPDGFKRTEERERSVAPGGAPLDVLDLSRRAYNCLRRAGLRTVAELASLTDEQILNIRQVGVKTLAEIREKLDAYLDEHPLPEQNQPPKFQEEDRTHLSGKTRIGVLKLSRDAYNALWRTGVLTLGQLVQLSSQEILDIQGIGQVELAEIEGKLQPYRALLLSEATSDAQASRDASIDVLDLSTRPHNALTRGGINTIGQLAQMSSGQIRAIYNIGQKSLAEIEEKLEAYLVEHPLPPPEPVAPVEPEPPSRLVDPALLTRAAQAPLDNISVERLALSVLWHKQLHQLDIESVGELVQQTTDVFGENSPVEKRLERYLTWLVEQDEATWADEVAGHGISPLHRLELAETSVRDVVEDWLSSPTKLDDRDRQVIRWRYGLYGSELTLEEAGERLGVSRERVRQLQNRALDLLSRPQSFAIIRPLMALLVYLLEQAGSLMNEEQVNAALQRELVVDNVDPIGVVHLVFEVNDDVKWLRGTGAWGLKSAPLNEVCGIQKRLARVLEKELVPLPIEEVIARFKTTRFYRNRQEELKDDFILACLRVHPEISIDDEGQCGLKQWDRHRLNEMILALREIGEPVHYTEIAEKTNALLEPEMQTSAHNIHAHMQRSPDIFVRVGHGVYGLREWGLHDDGSVANAAHRVLNEAGKPLHYDVVADRVLETWCVNPASVHAALQSDNRFINIGPGVYWLREKIATGSDAGEADFGDLFGERLEEWQEELPLEENAPGYDTHAEADAIRQMGTDFFK